MKLDLLRFEGVKRYRVKKIKEIGILDKTRKFKEDFLLEITVGKCDNEKIIVDFKVIEYDYFDNYVIVQKFLHLIRNRKVLLDKNGNYIKCINEDETMQEWKEFSKKIIKEAEIYPEQMRKNLKDMELGLKDGSIIKQTNDIYFLFFPEIYEKKVVDNIVEYNTSIDYFLGEINIPVKLKVEIIETKDSVILKSHHILDEIYFRQLEMQRMFQKCNIPVDYTINEMKSYYDFTMSISKNDHWIEKGMVKIGGKIEGIYVNLTTLYIEEVG